MSEERELLAADRADWLVDAVAMVTQDRRFLRGDPAHDTVLTEAIYDNGKAAILHALSRPPALGVEAGREAIWKVVHEVWQLLDDGETDGAGVTTIDQARLRAVSDAMDALEALVPDSEGPFWGGYPVNYFWPKGAGQ